MYHIYSYAFYWRFYIFVKKKIRYKLICVKIDEQSVPFFNFLNETCNSLFNNNKSKRWFKAPSCIKINRSVDQNKKENCELQSLIPHDSSTNWNKIIRTTHLERFVDAIFIRRLHSGLSTQWHSSAIGRSCLPRFWRRWRTTAL